MPISPYSQPAQAQFMPTYVPEPFQEILGAGLARQGRYDTNLAAQEQAIADLESMSAIPGADTKYITDAVVHVRDIADQYADKDYSNPEVVREISREVRKSGINRRNLADIQSSYSGYQEYMKQVADLRKRGLYAEDLGIDFTGYSTLDPSQGIFAGSPESVLAYRPKEEAYFNNLRGSRYVTKTGEIREYIDSTQIDKLAKEGASDYARSQEGEQKIRRYRNRTGDTGTSNEQLAYQFLQETGQEKKYNEFVGIDPRFKSTGKQEGFPFRYSVEKLLAAEEIPDKYTNLKKASKEVDKLHQNIIELEDIVQTSKNVREVESAKLQLDETRQEQEKIENASMWADIEATEAFSSETIDLLSQFSEDELPFYDSGSDTSFVGSPEYQKQITQLDGLKKDYAQDLLDTHGLKSEAEAINTVPATRIIKDEAGNMYGETFNRAAGEDGRFLPSNFGTIISDILTDPDVDERVVKSVGVSDNKLKKFKKASSLYVDGVSNPSDKEGSYVAVTAFKGEGKKKEKVGTYKLYLNTPTQIQTVAEVYMNDGNMRDAGRWFRPDIEQIIQSNTEGGGINTFTIPVDNTENIVANRQLNGNYILTIKSSGEKSRELAPSEISEFVYVNLF